ncbi:MAG: ATP-binding protein, partial [Actinobacteria bacterium]|nr:ATP-binding protein [Actinomycetota bacterium]
GEYRARPTILPDLSEEEQIVASSIASLGGRPLTELVTRPPFESPHHTASKVSIIGGGEGGSVRPGAVTRACFGILFLDETPQFPASVLDGLRHGIERAKDLDITAGLILCFLRDRPVAEAHETLRSVAGRASDLLGVGLDSAELGYPPSLFAEVFAEARALGLRTVAHAGEEGPPAYVTEALDLLHVERIDHGYRSLEDPALVERLRQERVPLTVCPLSNVCLGGVERLEAHPLKRMLAEGLLISINSDDPAYFGGYVDDALAATQQALQLDRGDIEALVLGGIESSFLDETRKAELRARAGAVSGS